MQLADMQMLRRADVAPQDMRHHEEPGSSHVEAEVGRLIALDAKRVDWDYPSDADFVVLADTEGNLFCVVA